MTFNTALSGLSAASADLKVTGNNIANASTTGFKSSRAQFVDVYASTLLGSGTNTVGSGVKLANVAQQFDQGNVSFTDNSLDLAVDGSGFFVLSDQGERAYTRAGMFEVDDQGYITSPDGARVQGFSANDSGTLSGILSDMRLQTSNLAPRRTTSVDATLNLDAREPVLSRVGTTTSTRGSAVGAAQGGIGEATSSVLETAGPPAPFDFSIDRPSALSGTNPITPFDFSVDGPSGTNATFQVSLSGADAPGENQTVDVTLDSDVSTLKDLIDDIREDLVDSGIGVDVREDPDALGRLQFYATSSGEESVIRIDPNDNATLGAGVTRSDVEAALGGISLGQGGTGGSSSELANPFGGNGATGISGKRTSASFDLTLRGASDGNGTATITLDSDIQDVDDLIRDVRDELAQSGLGVDVREDPDNAGRLQFFATRAGEASEIVVSNLDAANAGVTEADVVDTLNLATGVTEPGRPAVSNGYAAQSVDVVQADGSARAVTTEAGASAAEIAGKFNSSAAPGVSASATTSATLPADGFRNSSGGIGLSVNGVAVSGASLEELADAINDTSGLGTVSAELSDVGDLEVVDREGNDLVFEIRDGLAGDSVEVVGQQAASVTLETDGTRAAAVGGEVAFTLDEGVTLANADPAGSNVFGPLGDDAFEPFELNTFDPENQETYNGATSATIYDSLGNPHVMEMYFVKNRGEVAGEDGNQWTMHVMVDGRDVGDPDPNLPPPQNSEPTRASFNVAFNPDGTLDAERSDPVLISNWVPRDEDGNPNGADGPLNQLMGGSLPVSDPPTSSNFEIRLGETTQSGVDFALNSIDQNGFTAGELSGLGINEEGLVEARFTNGESQALGQIALADFPNEQGLKSVGDTAWVQTSDSGEPAIGTAASGSLGAITSGALEDSNVELSEQLVELMIAQRNFQANARTISTSDEITQTILNL
ncbi:MAG: flagellar hook-basal body complex protein [Pseudomonadota bacterium]